MEAADILKQIQVPLYWVGALTVAWVSMCTLYQVLNGLRVWVLGNGNLIKASKLGKWADPRGSKDTTLRTVAVQYLRFAQDGLKSAGT
ncbi:hypothetical protein QTP70_008374 [Hemibagrus guttatus]|uniref:Uncharacterized protein n=1 Tax=Hemibagrus guttatus TaxID=175788 RepID=A0AAE0PXC0_9TELE|nr:hypothetical protein QTP70_008374 [Hemibagrus guttatus]